MGDFFDNAVIFLEEYYVYVIGVGLIIILMLIGFLASRHKVKKDNHNGTMANINEVTTGSINDVANTIQGNNIEPVDVTTLSNDVPVSSSQVTSNDETEVLETGSVTNTDSFSNTNMQNVEPANNDIATSPIEEVKPNDEDNFNKTEVIDFSALSKPEPIVETDSANRTMDLNEFYNPSNNINPVTIGPVNPVTQDTTIKPATDINFTEPTPIQSINTMPVNEAVTEGVAPVENTVNEPVTDINPNKYDPFVVDNSQYDDILNGEASSTANDSKM
jgi:hypothetical protein